MLDIASSCGYTEIVHTHAITSSGRPWTHCLSAYSLGQIYRFSILINIETVFQADSHLLHDEHDTLAILGDRSDAHLSFDVNARLVRKCVSDLDNII